MQVNFTINIDDRIINFFRNLFKKKKLVFIVITIFASALVYAATITKPYTFAVGDLIDADQINQNFDTLYTKVNELDGQVSGVNALGNANLSCSSDQVAKYNGTAWVCASDDMGNHIATQNLDLGTNSLVGNGGTSGLYIDATGDVGIGTTSPGAMYPSTDVFPPVGGLDCAYDGSSCTCNTGYQWKDNDTDGNIDTGECYRYALDVNGRIIHSDVASSYYKKYRTGYTGNTWVDIASWTADRHVAVLRVVITTHQFGYAAGYWEYRVFRGTGPSDAGNIQLVNSSTYNSPTVPALQWNARTLQWSWGVNTTGGPMITVSATLLSSTYYGGPTFQ